MTVEYVINTNVLCNYSCTLLTVSIRVSIRSSSVAMHSVSRGSSVWGSSVAMHSVGGGSVARSVEAAVRTSSVLVDRGAGYGVNLGSAS